MLVHGGHGFKVLKEVEMLEIKQGPYSLIKDKIKFENTDENAIKINIYDQKKDLIQTWSITGYGEQLTESFEGNDAILNAINIALRDVGANLTIKLEKDMQELLNLMQ